MVDKKKKDSDVESVPQSIIIRMMMTGLLVNITFV